MKYLYCPRCKELRVKSWYAFNNKCPICFSDATPVKVPNSRLTYVQYLLYILAPALVVVYVLNDQRQYLYAALILVLVLMIVSWIELGRGRDYARTKVRKTSGDLEHFRKRGWG